jgi:hypothetical protein
MPEKKDTLSLRVAEQLLKKNRPRIWELSPKLKCEARKLFNEFYKKPTPKPLSDFFSEMSKSITVSVAGKEYILVRNSTYRNDYLMFDTQEEAELHAKEIPHNPYDMDKVMEEYCKPITKKLESLADAVMLAETDERKSKYEAFIKELETAEILITNKVDSLFAGFISGKLVPKNNC